MVAATCAPIRFTVVWLASRTKISRRAEIIHDRHPADNANANALNQNGWLQDATPAAIGKHRKSDARSGICRQTISLLSETDLGIMGHAYWCSDWLNSRLFERKQ